MGPEISEVPSLFEGDEGIKVDQSQNPNANDNERGKSSDSFQ